MILLLLLLYQKSKDSASKLKAYESFLRKSKTIFFYSVQIFILLWGAFMMLILLIEMGRNSRLKFFNIVECVGFVYFGILLIVRGSMDACKAQKKRKMMKTQAFR